ncbi:MAG TPA: CRTAC1 family protein [Bryobacteraceae bacterium]|nr:CRTAC1 family protein [Bryobacteraceae bacterium]
MNRVPSLALLLALPAGLVTAAGESRPPAVQFERVALAKTGIRWKHDAGLSAAKHLPETVGAGCAFLDYDNDGRLDVFLVNGGASTFYKPTAPVKNALYRNNGDGTFSDVTEKAGVAGGQFGMGVAVGDYDKDGWQDMYVTAYGRNLLYRNNGDGTFSEVGAKAGVALNGWFTHSVWFDADGDGYADLFVSSFVEYDPAENRVCGDPERKTQHYCIPRIFKPSPSVLFRNNKDGTFTDVSKTSGVASVQGKSFGAVATDINNDGRLDLFVANDTVANFLFVNRGKGQFEEVGLVAGVAYNEAGMPRSGMGVDAADVDGDGLQDLFVANIDQEMFSLYRNNGSEDFSDHSSEIRNATRLLSGWGLRFFDYDNDGDQDLILANGHPDDMIDSVKPLVTYKEPLLLFMNDGGKFTDVSQTSGSVFRERMPSRGLATGDFDDDGDLDVLISNNNEEPVLLRNQGGNRNHWVGLKLRGTQSDAAGTGALIIWQARGKKHQRLKTAGGSYLSSHDPREILGLGASESADLVEIRWPSGRVTTLKNVPAGKYIEVVEEAR